MGFFSRIKEGLQKTQSKLVHEIKRIVTRSAKLTGQTVEELEAALLGADLGLAMTDQIIREVKKSFETQGKSGEDVFTIGCREVEKALQGGHRSLRQNTQGLTVISVVGVNGTGKTTSVAKLAYWLHGQGHGVVIGACDTFRAAAIEQIKIWGERLNIPVIAGANNADPAAIAHDAAAAAISRGAKYLILDTAGRLHTKQNLMSELQKIHRVVGKKVPGAPHEVLLVLDASTGMNALNQTREFHKTVPLSGLIITKLDGTSRGGMVVAIQKELNLPVKFIGVGEQPDDLQPFVPSEFARALFGLQESSEVAA